MQSDDRRGLVSTVNVISLLARFASSSLWFAVAVETVGMEEVAVEKNGRAGWGAIVSSICI